MDNHIRSWNNALPYSDFWLPQSPPWYTRFWRTIRSYF